MAKQYLDRTGVTEVIEQTKVYVQNEAVAAAEAAGDAAVRTALGIYATTAADGVVSTTTQSFGGEKTFADGITVPAATDVKVGNAKLTYSTSGSDKILTVSFV